jgi:hypothetical protein
VSRILSIFLGRMDSLGYGGASGPAAERRHRFHLQHLAVRATLAGCARADIDVSDSLGKAPPIRDEASLEAARACFPGEISIPLPSGGMPFIFARLRAVLFGEDPDAIAIEAAKVVRASPESGRAALVDATLRDVQRGDEADAEERHRASFDQLNDAVAFGVARVVHASQPEGARPVLYLTVDVAARDQLFADLAAHQADAKDPGAIDWPTFKTRRARLMAGNDAVRLRVRMIELPVDQAVERECEG